MDGMMNDDYIDCGGAHLGFQFKDDDKLLQTLKKLKKSHAKLLAS